MHFSRQFFTSLWHGFKRLPRSPGTLQQIFWQKQPLPAVLKNFPKFTGKHLCWSLFLINLHAGLQCYLKETPAKMFFCEFCEIFDNTFFTKYFRTNDSVLKYWKLTRKKLECELFILKKYWQGFIIHFFFFWK